MGLSNSLFLFGDSFTNHSYDDCLDYIKNDMIQWGTIVSDEMNLNLKNFGKSASSNPQIISSIIENLWTIEKGDYVVIGLSSPFRTLTVRNGHISSFLVKDYLLSKTPENQWVYDYVKNIIYPNEELFDNFYLSQVDGIKKLLEKMGCTTYVWDSRLWNKFQTVKEQTKGKDKDPHWSKKGHEDMAKYILEKFNQNLKNTI